MRRVYLLESPLRRPGLVWAPTLLLALAAAAVAHWLPPRYTASALVGIDADTSDDEALVARGVDVVGRRLQAVVERVTDRTLLLAVSETLPLPPERLAAGLEVKRMASTSFWIEFAHRDPATAALVPNTIARLLVAESEAAAPGHSPALQARIEEARRLLVEKQAALALQQTPDTARGARSGAAPRTDPQAVAELLAVTDALAQARARADRLRRSETLPVPEPIAAEPSSSVASEDLEAMRAQLVELRKRYTEHHPEVVGLRARIARAEKRQATPAAVAATPDAEELRAALDVIDSLERRKAELAARAARLAATPAAAPASRATRERALAEQQQAQQAYDALLAEKAAAQSARPGGAVARFELLREAAVPEAAEPTPLPLAAAAGALLGLVLGLAWAAVAETRDHSVKGPEDLADILPVPVLTTVPELRQQDRRA